jgi:hypothetical protein
MQLRALWPASLALAVFSASLPAQTPTGAITGIVADPTQAPVAGAQVIVTSLATGGIVRTQTNSAGVYNAPSLPIGSYELRVETPGFKTYIAQNIVIEVTRLVRVDVTLLRAGRPAEHPNDHSDRRIGPNHSVRTEADVLMDWLLSAPVYAGRIGE